MKNPPLIALTRTWSVSGTTPNPDQTHAHYGYNFQLGVTAKTMEEAIAAARTVYPTATFHACHSRGDVHIVACEPDKHRHRKLPDPVPATGMHIPLVDNLGYDLDEDSPIDVAHREALDMLAASQAREIRLREENESLKRELSFDNLKCRLRARIADLTEELYDIPWIYGRKL